MARRRTKGGFLPGLPYGLPVGVDRLSRSGVGQVRTRSRAETEIMETAVETRIALEVRVT